MMPNLFQAAVAIDRLPRGDGIRSNTRGAAMKTWQDWLTPPIAVPILLIVIVVAYGLLR